MREIQLGFISNKSTARLLNILEDIEKKRLFTLGEIARKNNVSERTIASDIKYIKEVLGDCVNFSSSSKGFTFEEIHLSEYKDKKKELLANECLFEIIEQIFYGKFRHIDDLAHHYSYSESSFRRMLSQSSSTLNKYGLDWSTSPLSIKGNEIALRKFFKDFFYEGVETPYTVIPSSDLRELILKKVGNSIGEYDVGSGTTPQSFYYTLCISIIRSSNGNFVEIPQNIKEITYNEPDFSFLITIGEEIERIYDVKLPNEELVWIYLDTICKRTIDNLEQERQFFKRFNLWSEITQITDNFLDMRKINELDRSIIATFLNSFFLSKKINDIIEPSLNIEILDHVNQIISRDRELFEKNREFLQENLSKLSISPKYDMELCASFTIFTDMVLEIYSSSKTVYFLLEGNHFVCQSIRIKALKLFGIKHNLVFVPIQYLTKKILNENKIDLIITNYSRYITDFIENKEYILIKELPDDLDWSKIERKLGCYKQ